MSAALKRPPSRMTVDEFLAWDSGDYSGRRWQLVDGEPVAMAPASDNHAMIQAELARLLGNHLVESRRPCRVGTEPGVVPHVRANENWRIPDLGVTCAPPKGGVEMQAPVLLVEILSPNNYAETRANVWTYTTLPSMQDILVVNSVRIEAELLRRRDDGTWPEKPEAIPADGTVEFASIGFTVPLAALYRTTSLAR
jgi:Uma2 family endonuclease